MDIALLHIVLWAPLAGALLTMLFGQGMRARVVALLSTGFTLAASAWVYARYDLAAGGTQFESVAPFIPQIGSYLRIGVDGVSLPLVFLNCFLSFLVVLISWKFELRPQLYFVLVQLLQTAVTGVFVSLDLFVFFLFWELELAPMYLLIGIWGSSGHVRPQGLFGWAMGRTGVGTKEYAAMKLTLYLLFGSAFILVGILALYVAGGSQSFSFLTFEGMRFDPALQ